MGTARARIGELRRETVQRGRPYLAGAAAALVLVAVAISGAFGALLGAALIVGLLLLMRHFDQAPTPGAGPAASSQPSPADVAAPAAEQVPVAGRVTNAEHFDTRLAATHRALDYDQTLSALVGLVGRRVQVMLAAGGDQWVVGEIHGTLSEGRDIAEGPEEEILFAIVDGENDVAGAFAMPAAQFVSGLGMHGTRNPGVAFRAGGSVVWVFDMGAPHSSAGWRGSRGAQQ